jgi:hypothetical protein
MYIYSSNNLDWDMDFFTEYSDKILKRKYSRNKKDIDDAKEYKAYEKCWKRTFQKISVNNLSDYLPAKRLENNGL